MKRLNPPRTLDVFWVALAVIFGVLIALTSSAEITLTILIALLLLLFSIIHPLAAALAMLILAPMRTLIETEAVFRLPLDIGQITILLIAFGWLLHRTAADKRLFTFVWTPLYIPLGIFIAVAGITAFNALSISAWLNEWLKWVVIAILIAFVLMLRHWHWLVIGLMLSGIANALVGIYIFFGGSGALHLLINNRYFRAFGTFGQPNPFGGFMGLLAPIAAALSVAYLLRLWKQRRSSDFFNLLFYVTAFGLLAVGVIISWSRGAWLGFGVSMLVVILAIPHKIWQSLILLLLLITIVGVLWTSGRIPSAVVERINSATEEIFTFDDVRGVDITPENYAVVERLAHWQAALNMIRANWWLGVGIGNYEVAYDRYRLINWGEPLGHAHNYYLNVFAETGIMGAAAYGALWISIFLITWRSRRHPDSTARFVAIGLLGTWTYLGVHSLTDNLYVNNLFLHIGIMLGVISLIYYQASQGVRLRTL